MLLFIIYFSIYRPIQHSQMQGNLSLHKHGEIKYFLFAKPHACISQLFCPADYQINDKIILWFFSAEDQG